MHLPGFLTIIRMGLWHSQAVFYLSLLRYVVRLNL